MTDSKHKSAELRLLGSSTISETESHHQKLFSALCKRSQLTLDHSEIERVHNKLGERIQSTKLTIQFIKAEDLSDLSEESKSAKAENDDFIGFAKVKYSKQYRAVNK